MLRHYEEAPQRMLVGLLWGPLIGGMGVASQGFGACASAHLPVCGRLHNWLRFTVTLLLVAGPGRESVALVMARSECAATCLLVVLVRVTAEIAV